jgi:hypothetical protein
MTRCGIIKVFNEGDMVGVENAVMLRVPESIGFGVRGIADKCVSLRARQKFWICR